MLQVHLAVLLFGLAGLFGKGLALSPLLIVWGRAFFATLALCGLRLIRRNGEIRKTGSGKKLFIAITIAGLVLAIHWIAFFQAIQVSTVAIGLLGFSTFPVFVTLLEPVIFNERLRQFDLFTAGMILAGLLILTPSIDPQNIIVQGVLWGILSGATFALLSIMNRKLVASQSAMSIAMYENLIASMVLTPLIGSRLTEISISDWAWLFILGVLCTGLSHALFIAGLKHMKTQLAGLIVALEPVYGIIFALLIFHEIPSLRTIIGGGVIIAAILLASTHSRIDTSKLRSEKSIPNGYENS